MTQQQNGNSFQPASPTQPTLCITRLAWTKLQAYVCGVKGEISGFAYVQRHGSSYWVTEPEDVFITRQEVTGGSADVDGSTFARAADRAALDGRDEELKLQWHSHVNGQAYFSGKDITTIDGYAEGGVKWIFSLVTNKRGDAAVRLDQYAPLRISVTATLKIIDYLPADIERAVEEDIAELVTEKKFPVIMPSTTVVTFPKGRWFGKKAVDPTLMDEEDDDSVVVPHIYGGDPFS
jgi:hypothetical protein